MDEQIYRLDEQVGFLLRRAGQRHLSVFATVIPEVTTTQFAAMARLAELGPLSQNQLGRVTAMDAATIKGVVGRLVNRRLVVTAPSAEDRRRLIVDLTPEGRALFAEASATAASRPAARPSPRSPPPSASASWHCCASSPEGNQTPPTRVCQARGGGLKLVPGEAGDEHAAGRALHSGWLGPEPAHATATPWRSATRRTSTGSGRAARTRSSPRTGPTSACPRARWAIPRSGI